MAAWKDQIFATKQELDDFVAGVNRGNDAMRTGTTELQSMIAQLRDANDQANGNQEAVEQRRFEAELARIKELSKQQGVAAQADAAEAERLARLQHERNLQSIRKESAARNGDANAGGGSTAPAGSGALGKKQESGQTVGTIQVTLPGGGKVPVTGTAKTAQDIKALFDAIARDRAASGLSSVGPRGRH
jgi:hypothetical protein